MIKKVFQSLFASKKISTYDELLEFIIKYSAQMSGDLVIKYSQKRLGKIHYNLSSSDENYAKELVACQSQLHAWVMVDYYFLLMKLTELLDIRSSENLIRCLLKIHQDYINSAPVELTYTSSLSSQDFCIQKANLRDMANTTGKKLFELLPMTEHMKKGDVVIFQGQIRLSYINFLTDLDKKIKPIGLTKLFMMSKDR